MDRTNAERQQRWRDKRNALAKRAEQWETERAALKAENAALKAERRKTAKPVTKPVDPESKEARYKATIADLRARLRYFQMRPQGKIDQRTSTLIRSNLHPDRVKDPEHKARFRIAFEVYGERERLWVDEDQAFIANEKDMLLGRKAQAKKRQHKPSPKSVKGLPKT